MVKDIHFSLDVHIQRYIIYTNIVIYSRILILKYDPARFFKVHLLRKIGYKLNIMHHLHSHFNEEQIKVLQNEHYH